MANIPIINPPDKEHLGFCWHHQFTIPLLFDDCLSLLQKVCALWAKLNDVIDALNEFNAEFNAWAKSVEESLKDLYAKYEALDTRVTNIEEQLQNIQTELNNIKNDITNINQRLDNIENRVSNIENEITDIEQSISNINNSITQIQADMTALEARVKKLEDLLKNLNIIPPIDIYNATDEEFKNGLWQNWWNWLKDKLVFRTQAPVERWEYSSNVVWWDTSTRLPRFFQLGRVTQPITLCKLPFIAVCKGVFDSLPDYPTARSIIPLYKQRQFTPSDGFFDFTLSRPFGYTMDEIKFQTSYVPFLPNDSLMINSDVSNTIRDSKNVNCGVRLQVPNTGTNAKLCLTTEQLTIAICPDSDPITSNTKWDLYIYAIAENG
jgi:archaellum component FlaC